MWQRNFRKHKGITYRKRFRCPECKEYTLHIEHDQYAECEECGQIRGYDIQKIIQKDDYQDYYTSEELEESFYMLDDEYINSYLKDITYDKVPLIKVFSDKERKQIYECFKVSNKFDDILDDFFIKYSRKYPESKNSTDETVEGFEYLFNLIEDAHFFVNNSLLSVVFYEYGTINGIESLNDEKSSIVFSGEFFLTNSGYQCVSSWERIINILGVLFKVEYDFENPRNNSFKRIHEKLNKINEFKNSDIDKIIRKVREKGYFNKISRVRIENNHDISRIWRMGKDLSRKDNDGNSNFEINLKSIACDIIKNSESIYQILEKIIIILEEKLEHDEKSEIVVPFLKKKYDTKYLENVVNQFSERNLISGKNINEINRKYGELIIRNKIQFTRKNIQEYRLKDMNKLSIQLKIKILYLDVIFRMKEVCKCLSDTINCENKSIYKHYPFDERILNEQYFIYAALFRAYSCYDKMGIVVKEILNIENVNKYDYFERIVYLILNDNSVNNTNNDIVKCIKWISQQECFKEFYQFRNTLFHSERLGMMYGDDGFYIFNKKMFNLIYDNTELLYSLIAVVEEELKKTLS